MIYFENFSFVSFLSCLLKFNLLKNLSIKGFKTIYYIDSSLFAQKLLLPFLRLLGLTVEKLQFTMLEIIDSKGELIRSRIPRLDLFNFQEKILNSEGFKALYHKSWDQDAIPDYINKGLIDGDVKVEDSVNRGLFIIHVVFWHMQKIDYKQAVFVFNNRAWINIYKEYAESYKIELLSVRSILFKFSDLRKIVRKVPLLYKIIKNIKYRNISQKYDFQNKANNKIYVDGRGDLNLVNNGYHSDFFWQLNSKFLLHNILYKHHSNKEKEYLSKNGVYSIGEGIYSDSGGYRKYIKPKLNYSHYFRKEFKVVQDILTSYDLDRFYWASLFRQHDVKIFLTWDKYSNSHIVLSDAIKENGGISVNWQMAFDGYKNADSLINSDIVFSYSKFSTEIDKKIKSKIKYNVIVGYPKDYASALLRDEAKKLREKLEANGAKKIVFVIDENSGNDSRWHTGHELQRENYSLILEKVLETPWLGVIFKPKRAINLRQRLGQVEKLLDKALATGRCHVFEVSGRYSTSAPPILAGLASDVCIHGHLGAGTAGLECALEGLPTLLIDRERYSYSKLYDLPKGKVVFQDWPSAIDALMEHFGSSNGVSGFGDWSSIIDELDPYRDGLAAYRMGTYLKWLIDGYDKGLKREDVMLNAARMYEEKWGPDKIIIS